MRLLVGTSGYSYKEWKGFFYPEELPAKEMLSYYSTRLPAVEINNTFYRLPREEALVFFKHEETAGRSLPSASQGCSRLAETGEGQAV